MPPPIIVKSFRAKSQAKAGAALQADAAWAGQEGYRPVSQSWAEGGRTPAASLFVGLGVLCLVGGLFFIPLFLFALIFLVIGVASGKGDGQLTVTYQRPDHPDPVVAAATPPVADHLGALESLTAMRDRGLITVEQYEAKKAELLNRI